MARTGPTLCRLGALAMATMLVQPAAALSTETSELFFGTGPARPGCSGCHGMDAAGGREEGREMPSIQWRSLARRAGKRPPYDAAALGRLLATGIRPDGAAISAPMPRYDLSSGQVAALVQLLATVGDPESQGVYPDRLEFGMILPRPDRAAPHHRRAAMLVESIFAEVNADGGVYGRRLVLARFDGRADFARGERPVLAALLTFDRGDASAGLDAEATPELMPIRPIGLAEDSRRVRGFTAGEADVARALIDYLDRQLHVEAVMILAGADAAARSVRRSAELELRVRDIALVERPEQAGEHRGAAILALGGGDAPTCDASFTVIAGALDVMAGMDGAQLRRCGWKAVVGDTRFMPDETGPDAARLARLAGTSEPLDTDRAAYVAAELAVKAAIEAGRSVTRRRLVEALERIGPQDFGVWPRLDYRQNPLTGTREVRVEEASILLRP
ncbi:hypothetical protein NDN16_17625 [Aureimonas altamirensis]|uniref:hypothetical protein n=1 Tax=Aureimonas altamirensis TaxID=370622 RepID=UPI002036CBC5|nr:hypothetical protein [Aureimonas altamirensis]MCM2505490.1 hypothetical protein [Aureimonas altamirensis]